ncbi:MAG: acetyl-CoA C-acyltransferase [Flavobacteriaceae bacterium]|nr:acetyl-CoA C-acyltransferase [Flavobacteriaceae bacterium]MBT4950906.1 acetyl-CoA C-acyltransferase [Pelagibacteraceae bacterium]MBT3794085.1 acetyl-CoA C-acyltransferase [Flavobacteriaceae bacterium]MBT4415484.1 acetyl-CoA C-acyltransferase [Flavobacteriaceae bacterium]MBT5396444.1 acetyl-CoA C-acyltransferase [Flavobacteriaceae bacterium]
MTKNEVYIVSAVRTPLGSFGGVFANIPATKLGSIAIKGALNKANVNSKNIDEVFMGNVCSANLGQAPARQAAIAAGIPATVPCTTINKVCSSGAKSIMFAAQSILLGQADILVAGGMENMSAIPYYVPKARFGYKYGNSELIDGLHKDGLLDPYDEIAMGVFADKTAEKYNISREEQDAFAIRSYKNSAAANENGIFANEIVSVTVPQRRGEPLIIKEDEEYKNVKFEKIPQLRAAFSKDGTVTAANASTINDGASALILASTKAVIKYDLKPIAKILSFADAAQEPQWFTTAPTIAAPKALKLAKMNSNDVDFFEVNEAFSVVPLAFNKILDIDINKVNVHGGAVSMGHPLGASGARIVTTLSNVLQSKNATVGCAVICNGGGGASSIVIEKL